MTSTCHFLKCFCWRLAQNSSKPPLAVWAARPGSLDHAQFCIWKRWKIEVKCILDILLGRRSSHNTSPCNRGGFIRNQAEKHLQGIYKIPDNKTRRMVLSPSVNVMCASIWVKGITTWGIGSQVITGLINLLQCFLQDIRYIKNTAWRRPIYCECIHIISLRCPASNLTGYMA